jgi:hypothetical protein
MSFLPTILEAYSKILKVSNFTNFSQHVSTNVVIIRCKLKIYARKAVELIDNK